MEKDSFVFISYSRKDGETAKEIIDILEEKGVKVYVDYKDIPPGSVFAEEIVNAIERCLCCLLMYTADSNKSGYVLNEMNSAVNHNKPIIPLRLDGTIPSKAMEFYIGKNNWVDYVDPSSLDHLIKTIQAMRQQVHQESEIRYKGPVVLDHRQLEELGYTTEKKVIETIEIDYKTLGDAPNEYLIDEETEGTLQDWFDYANSYPETSSFLVVNGRIVGYCQVELISEENYDSVIGGREMIASSMEEFYGFGGDFCCYIAIMPILKEHENQGNYLLLLEEFFRRMVAFAQEDIHILKYGISVYTPLLETMLGRLGFQCVGTNPVGGKIMELTLDTVLSNPIFKKRYPDFYQICGGEI